LSAGETPVQAVPEKPQLLPLTSVKYSSDGSLSKFNDVADAGKWAGKVS
jgi:hypothetical protein